MSTAPGCSDLSLSNSWWREERGREREREGREEREREGTRRRRRWRRRENGERRSTTHELYCIMGKIFCYSFKTRKEREAEEERERGGRERGREEREGERETRERQGFLVHPQTQKSLTKA